MTLSELHHYVSSKLSFETYDTVDTINGIQVANRNRSVKKIAYAVDSSLSVIQNAVEQEVDVLLVHHGLFWKKTEPIVGDHFEKISLLTTSNMALYAIHLPLDMHPQWGNNAQLAKRIGLTSFKEFGNFYGICIGIEGRLPHEKTVEEIYNALFKDDGYGHTSLDIVKCNSIELYASQNKGNIPPSLIHAYQGGKKKISKIAIISGGGTSKIDEANDIGADLFITGDPSHIGYLRARALHMNAMFIGHYFSEIWGVLALGAHLLHEKNIEGVFIDDPTGL